MSKSNSVERNCLISSLILTTVSLGAHIPTIQSSAYRLYQTRKSLEAAEAAEAAEAVVAYAVSLIMDGDWYMLCVACLLYKGLCRRRDSHVLLGLL